ncbi:LTA synthase family protein [Planococcus sp. X10-3]|uniref:LTA synthase family protein n=1 Tax=Planococcus sp. X10-3 TaxID=3061240 RepID=UPI003BAEB629
MISLGTILLSTFWVLFLHGRVRLVGIFLINLLLTFVILSDIIYYRYFQDIISITVLMQMSQLGDVGESVFALFSWMDLIFVLDLIIMIPLIVYYFRKTNNTKKDKPSFIPKLLTAMLVLFIGFQLTFIPFNKAMENGGEWQFNKLISNMRVYNMTGLLGFHGTNLKRYVNDNYINKKEYSEEEILAVENWFVNKNANPVKGPYSGMGEGKNVIVLQVEALQDFVINEKINNQEITPFLNSLIEEEGIYFPNFYEQTALGRTSDAEFLLNTSLYPTAQGAAYMLHAENHYDALPKLLKEENYSTHVFHSYQPSFWNRYIMYKQLGIDQFYSEDDFVDAEKIGWSLNDNDMLQQSLEEMKQMETPFYSHLITLTSHHPFEIPEKYHELNVEGYTSYAARHFRNYLHSIHYVDQAIENFVEGLKKEGMWEDTVLVIFGDHSTGLTVDDPAFAEFADAQEQASYFEANKNVPLILHVPGADGPAQFDQVGSQVDLAPTLLDIIKPQEEIRYWIGNNLWAEENRQAIFRDGSYISSEFIFVASNDGNFSNGSCFDRQTEEPLEVQQCSALFEGAVQSLRMSDDVLEGNLVEKFAQ